MFSPPMPRPPLSLSPRPSLSLNRSRDDDDGDDPMMNTPGVRPPVRFPTPQLVRTPSGGVSPVPSRPPSRATPSPTPPGHRSGPARRHLLSRGSLASTSQTPSLTSSRHHPAPGNCRRRHPKRATTLPTQLT